MTELEQQIKQRLREVLDFTNENLATPGRVKIFFGRGKTIVLLFADSSSESIETIAQDSDNPQTQRWIKLQRKSVLSPEENQELKDLTEALLKRSQGKHPVSSVFQIIAIASAFCQRNFHHRDRLQAFMTVLISATHQIEKS